MAKTIVPVADYRVECIQVICPHCGFYLEVEEGGHIPVPGEGENSTCTLGPNEYLPLRGRVVTCPAKDCGKKFRMPTVSMERRRRAGQR